MPKKKKKKKDKKTKGKEKELSSSSGELELSQFESAQEFYVLTIVLSLFDYFSETRYT